MPESHVEARFSFAFLTRTPIQLQHIQSAIDLKATTGILTGHQSSQHFSSLRVLLA